jgi:hypothetical protein
LPAHSSGVSVASQSLSVGHLGAWSPEADGLGHRWRGAARRHIATPHPHPGAWTSAATTRDAVPRTAPLAPNELRGSRLCSRGTRVAMRSIARWAVRRFATWPHPIPIPGCGAAPLSGLL